MTFGRSDGPCRADRQRTPLALLARALVLTVAMRLYHFHAPLLDQHHGKQVFIANKARNIAKSLQSAVWKSFDFLDDRGERMTRVEEVPLYTGLVGGCYYLIGEREWLGRAWSILATLVPIIAFYDLVQREYDEETGLAASFLFAISPLTIFYGRAVLPDPRMLASMLICAAFYRRYLDDGRRSSWLAAALFGLLAAGFKYYGLMVLVPLRAAQRAGRGGVGRRWLAVRPERDQPAARGTTLAYCCDPGCYRAHPVAVGDGCEVRDGVAAWDSGEPAQSTVYAIRKSHRLGPRVRLACRPLQPPPGLGR